MKLKVVDITGKETGKEVNLPADVFGIEPNDHAIYLDVKQHMANKRSGTHKSKDKSEIVGSTRKLKKQKGTGTARAGSIKSGVFRGGGRFHGPRPRDYSFKLNKKLKRLARKSALSYKAQENNVVAISAMEMEGIKTKNFKSILGDLNMTNVRTLFVLPEGNKNVYLSARNIPNTEVLAAKDVNTYQILKASKLVLVEGSIKSIEDTLS